VSGETDAPVVIIAWAGNIVCSRPDKPMTAASLDVTREKREACYREGHDWDHGFRQGSTCRRCGEELT